MPDKVALVVSKVNQVAMTKEWFTKNVALGLQQITYHSIPLDQISRVRSFWNRITIDYSDETGKSTSTWIDCRTYKTSIAVMLVLQNRLGGRFERVSKSIVSRWVVAIVSALVLFVTYRGTSFLYSWTQESVGQELQGRGRALLLEATLKFLGPNGVGCIGLILLLLLFCFAALLFANPPAERLLVRKETRGR